MNEEKEKRKRLSRIEIWGMSLNASSANEIRLPFWNDINDVKLCFFQPPGELGKRPTWGVFFGEKKGKKNHAPPFAEVYEQMTDTGGKSMIIHFFPPSKLTPDRAQWKNIEDLQNTLAGNVRAYFKDKSVYREVYESI